MSSWPASAANSNRSSTGSERFTLDTVYLGGGTPSRLGPDGIDRLLAIVRQFFDLAPDAEITIEANPDDVTSGAAARWRAVA